MSIPSGIWNDSRMGSLTMVFQVGLMILLNQSGGHSYLMFLQINRKDLRQAWWHMPVILATGEAKAGESQV